MPSSTHSPTRSQEASRVLGLGRDGTFEKACIDEFLELRMEQEVCTCECMRKSILRFVLFCRSMEICGVLLLLLSCPYYRFHCHRWHSRRIIVTNPCFTLSIDIVLHILSYSNQSHPISFDRTAPPKRIYARNRTQHVHVHRRHAP